MKLDPITLNLKFIQWPLVKINFTIKKQKTKTQTTRVADFSSNARLKYGKQYPHERCGLCIDLLCIGFKISLFSV